MMRKLLLALGLLVGAALAPQAARADCPFQTILTAAPALSQACVVQGPGAGGAMPVTGTISATTTFPYGTAANQAGAAASFVGIASWDGAHIQPILIDPTGRVIVSCTSGCAVPTFPYNLTNGQAVVAASALGVGGLDANGKFSPLAEDASQNLLVKLNVALPAGTNVIGHVIVDSGTITSNQGTANATPWNENIAQVGGSALALGSAVSASSLPVVIASDQAAVSVKYGSGTFVISGTVTANQGTANATPWNSNIAQIGGSAISIGQAAMAASAPVAIASDQSAIAVKYGSGTFVISGTVTANQGGSPWGMNLTQVGGAAVALGSAVSASSIPVVVASDQAAVAVKYGSGTFAVNFTQYLGAAAMTAPASGAFPIAECDKTTATQCGTVDANGNRAVQIFNGATGPASIAGNTADGQTIGNAIGTKTPIYVAVGGGTTWDRWREAVGTTGVASVNTEGTKTTYRLAGLVTPGAAPTEVIQLVGSGTKTVRVTRVSITVESTTAGIADIVLMRESAAVSGGTCAAKTVGKMDSTNAAATATNVVCTANPTVGTFVANLGAAKASGTQGLPIVWDFTTRNDQALVLRGTSEALGINGNGDTLLTGETWAYDIEWTEE
jgi:hypothetical protein